MIDCLDYNRRKLFKNDSKKNKNNACYHPNLFCRYSIFCFLFFISFKIDFRTPSFDCFSFGIVSIQLSEGKDKEQKSANKYFCENSFFVRSVDSKFSITELKFNASDPSRMLDVLVDSSCAIPCKIFSS